MIVVAMIGVLASVGMASFNRYMYETKVSEIKNNVERIFGNYEAFGHSATVASGNGMDEDLYFPMNVTKTTGGWQPHWTLCMNTTPCKSFGNYENPTWKVLKFELAKQPRASFYIWTRRYSSYRDFRVYVIHDTDADGVRDYKVYRRIYYNNGNRLNQRWNYGDD